MPTNINNVETWATVPVIIARGADWFSGIGTEDSKGTKVFSLVGKVKNTGLVEVPMGITLRDIIYEIGEGMLEDKKFKAVQTGGPSGGCIPNKLIDLSVDYESLSQAGSIMGSGGMVVMDEDTCIVDVAKYFLDFTKDESCGKCNACREGTDAMFKILDKISRGEGEEKDLALLEDLGNGIKDVALCGLGQTAPNPVLSTIQHFRDEYLAHIKYKRCPAAVCKGIVSSPCQHACPLGQDVPSYIAYIARGQFDEAIRIIRKENPFPSICGRVCHSPCEAKCKSGDGGDPIAIRALKMFAADYEFRKRTNPVEQKPQTYEEKIAVIGSGPAGLTCAYFLAKKGYRVTVLESLPVAGGMLAVGIPEYRLPRKFLNAEIDAIKAMGVEIKTNTCVGKDIAIDVLTNNYQAIFIATGAHKGLTMNIPGEDVMGVIDAIAFLRDVNLGKKVNIGKKVAVVGGGNAAIDAARTAVRLGCKKVILLYRRTRKEMPAFPEEVAAAVEEGIDIQLLTNPVKVLSENSKLQAVECIRMKLGEFDKSGRRSPTPVEGSEFQIELDTMIYAIRQEPDLSFNEANTLQVCKYNTIMTDPEILTTSKPGIFAGGDVITGPATVTEAMKSGKIAAQSIHKYLRREPPTLEYKVTRPVVYIEPLQLTEEEAENVLESRRHEIPKLTVKERIDNFREVALGFSEDMAVKEARRCLRCDLQNKNGVG